MAISLQKGGNVSLTKEAPGVTEFTVGLGWDVRATSGTDFDLDAFALLVGADGKVRGEKDFVYFNNKSDADGSVVHGGDNLTGAGDGDDETIKIDLSKIPADVDKVVVAVSIYEGNNRSQTFGQVANSYIRLLNGAVEEVRYDLGEDSALDSAVLLGEIYRNGTDWKFRAIDQGFSNGMEGVIATFGL